MRWRIYPETGQIQLVDIKEAAAADAAHAAAEAARIDRLLDMDRDEYIEDEDTRAAAAAAAAEAAAKEEEEGEEEEEEGQQMTPEQAAAEGAAAARAAALEFLATGSNGMEAAAKGAAAAAGAANTGLCIRIFAAATAASPHAAKLANCNPNDKGQRLAFAP
ncbi:hypothetical protein EMWEY_00048290 [Eimeria maxima]|uniref:Uncharacterized protein n=1 Tax=Eimeria maxima TaxID=5804 RepID=U6M0W7_EIMMA|nr:hypothetical protein EMWEY_00048290 [Eimeria maxima]CDJ56064.1 hypothetical protein EMWEY_00048290 [Eimeria maxima]